MLNKITFRYLTKRIFYFTLYFPNIIYFIAIAISFYIGINTGIDKGILINIIATIVFSVVIGPILRCIFIHKCTIYFEENTFTIISNGEKIEIAYNDTLKLKYCNINRTLTRRSIQFWNFEHFINIITKTSQYFFASTLMDSSNSYKQNERPVIYAICLELSRRSGCHLLCTSNGEKFQSKHLND